MLNLLQSFLFNLLTKLRVGFNFQVEHSSIILEKKKKGLNIVLLLFLLLCGREKYRIQSWVWWTPTRFGEPRPRIGQIIQLSNIYINIYSHSLENAWDFFWFRLFLKPSMFLLVKQPGRKLSIFTFRSSSTATQRSSVFIPPCLAGIFSSQVKTFSWISSMFCWHRTLHKALAYFSY